MINNENKRASFLVEDGQSKAGDKPAGDKRSNIMKLKKPLIFALMGVVCCSCMYLIFKPAQKDQKARDAGLNESVPQATDAGLAPDKQKAYEQELLDKKQQEQRSGLASLSDYWNEESSGISSTAAEGDEAEEGYGYVRGSTNGYVRGQANQGNGALNSYRNAQSTLGSFYQDDNSQELRRQVAELKEQLAGKDMPETTTADDQLALMEKSYQLAAKYLPSGSGTTGAPKQTDTATAVLPVSAQEQFVAVVPVHKRIVSALYREPTDSAFFANLQGERNWDFYTATATGQLAGHPKNSIRACVQHTQVVTTESDVTLRLLEPVKTTVGIIPQGTEVTAQARLQGGRLQLKVSAIQWEGNVVPVDITVYGLDGQQGLAVPYSPEMNALTEIASNMAQTSGTSIMMTRSAGQQVAGDLSRGLVQGISGYFSKKIRTPNVTLKAGYQVLLVPKK